LLGALKWTVAGLVIGSAALISLWALDVVPWSGGEYVDCTVARSAADYGPGGRVAHGRALFAQVLARSECLATDDELDAADGARRGRVRWLPCPDC
jgi:hypothetical protein